MINLWDRITGGSSRFRKMGNKEKTDQLNLISKHPNSEPKLNSIQAEKRRFRFSGTVVSDTGLVRTNNEDNYILGKYMNVSSADHSEAAYSLSDNSEWQFAGVFDGMGGGEMGEIASNDTASIFLESIARLGGTPSKTEVDLCMRSAFLKANNRINDLQKEFKIYGTTGTVLCFNGEEVKIYHLGDSRAYFLRNGGMFQITRDQTLAQMKIDSGLYDENDPSSEADKHKLTEYIGRDWTRENIKPVESSWITVKTGDRILLCSDGLYDMCSDQELTGILYSEETGKDIASVLVNKALENGGVDNITCVLTDFS